MGHDPPELAATFQSGSSRASSGAETLPATGEGLAATAGRASVRGAEPGVPDRIGRFRVDAKLGEGAMGVVLSATDEELGRKVALKLLHETTATSSARFRREAAAMAMLSHPNVAQIYEVGVWEGRVFLAIEFIDGLTLREWLDARERSTAEILAVLVDAGRGLVAAHQAGLVHRDFKPDNIMVGADGRARVLDFGVAGSLDATEIVEQQALMQTDAASPMDVRLTRTGALVGTPAYMSPEQLLGRGATAASDQFSLCVTAYEALFGRRPFEGASLWELGANIMGGRVLPPPRAASVPRHVRSAILRGLSVEPSDRHADVSALLRELHSGPASQRQLRRLGAAGVAVAVGALGFGFWRAMGAEDEAADTRVPRRAAPPPPGAVAPREPPPPLKFLEETMVAKGNVSPLAPGPPGDWKSSFVYCEGLAEQAFAGVDQWSLGTRWALPDFTNALPPGDYWTAQSDETHAIVLRVPSDPSMWPEPVRLPKDEQGARPVCVAPYTGDALDEMATSMVEIGFSFGIAGVQVLSPDASILYGVVRRDGMAIRLPVSEEKWKCLFRHPSKEDYPVELVPSRSKSYDFTGKLEDRH